MKLLEAKRNKLQIPRQKVFKPNLWRQISALTGTVAISFFLSSEHAKAQEIVPLPPPDSTYMFDGRLFEILAMPFFPASTIEKEGITVLMEKPGYENKVERITEIISEVNQYLENKVKTVVLRDSKNMPQDCKGYELDVVGMMHNSTFYSVIKLLDDGNELRAKIIPFHEACHHYIDNCNKDTTGLESVYWEILRFAQQNSELHEKMATKWSTEKWLFEGKPLIRLFDISTFMPGSDPYEGHPYDLWNDLAANGSDILKFFHKQLFLELDKINKTDPGQYKLAIKGYKEIIAFWGEDRIFPSQVYKRLKNETN